MRSRGFTLVELLMVMALLMLALTLLTPALRRPAAEAKLTGCQAVLAGMAKANAKYTTDNREWLTTGASSPWVKGEFVPTHQAVNMYHPPKNFCAIGQLLLGDYLPDKPEAFGCPDSVNREEKGYNISVVNVTEGMYAANLDPNQPHYYRGLLNENWNGGYTQTTYAVRHEGPRHRITDIRQDMSKADSAPLRPRQFAWFADHEQASQKLRDEMAKEPEGASPLRGWGRVHREGFNVAYLDGHVALFKDEQRSLIWRNSNVRDYGSAWAIKMMDQD